MAADTSYIYTVKTVNDAVVIDGVRRFGGYDGAEYTYTLDAATLLPRRIELENNPRSDRRTEHSRNIQLAAGKAFGVHD